MIRKIFLKTREMVGRMFEWFTHHGSSALFSFFVAVLIIATIGFSGIKIYGLYGDLIEFDIDRTFYDILFVMVLLRAFRVLLTCYRGRTIDVRYFIELAISMSAIEIVLGQGERSPFFYLTLALFGIANTVIYLLFWDTLSKTSKTDD